MISRFIVLLGAVWIPACTSVIGWNDLSFEDGGVGVVVPCVGKTCADLQLQCGAAPDGCGKTVLCGKCGAGEQCGGGGTNLCGTHPCTPLTCADAQECGVISDGCAATINCTDSCGGPCVPGTCASKGAQCGTVDDGCGAQLSCGECTAPASCNGSNQCATGGCTAKSCAELGADCGTIGDGCGTNLDCGTCTSGTCNANKCNCSPQTCAALGAECGTVSDGCGKNLECGTCSGDTCGGGGTPNKCGGSAQTFCVDTINQYRASIGRPPLQRWTAAESCSDAEAKSDSQTQQPHGAFGQCGENAQDECPGWPGPLKDLLAGCLQMMWDEGPGGGHYENMANPNASRVACGFSATSGGSIWAVQNFQ